MACPESNSTLVHILQLEGSVDTALENDTKNQVLKLALPLGKLTPYSLTKFPLRFPNLAALGRDGTKD